jgi:hypothetical protein
VALRVPAVWADVRAAVADGLRLTWLGAAAAAEAPCVAGLVTQRLLLAAVGALDAGPDRDAAVFASAGLARLLLAGPAAAAWRGSPPPRFTLDQARERLWGM